MGDFNFIEDPDDTTTYTSHYHHTPEFAREWGKYCSYFDLTEIPQHAHTYYYRAAQNTLRRSSRLDGSTPASPRRTMPSSVLLPSLHLSLTASGPAATTPTPRLRWSCAPGSDHAPVGLHYNPHRPDHAPSVHYPTVPFWLAEDPEFEATFMESWLVSNPMPPFQPLCLPPTP